MRFLDILFGRSKPVKSQLDSLFAIATAQITLNAKLALAPATKAGVCFRPVGSSDFEAAERELKDILYLSTRTTGSRVDVTSDGFGFHWVMVDDPDFDDLVATIHTVSLTLEEHGFRDQLLAAAFKFMGEGRNQVYWIYNYKRGQFYPFVPIGDSKERDNALELRLKGAMEGELPIDRDIERWYALWGVPV